MAKLSTMTEAEKDALGNKILSKLVELYADQMGVTVEYMIAKRGDDHGNHNGTAAVGNGGQRNGAA